MLTNSDSGWVEFTDTTIPGLRFYRAGSFVTVQE